MLGKRIINTATGAAAACTTDTVQILDGVPFQSIATYQFENNANDLTTNYNGTASNVTYATGKFGNAAVFNGSSSQITFPYLSGITPTSDISASLWINGNAQGNADNVILSLWDNSNLELRVDNFSPSVNKIIIVYRTSSYGSIDSTFTMDIGSWTHLAFTYSYGIGFTVYKNGVSSGLLPFTGTIGTLGGTNKIGAFGLSNSQYFNGSIDQVRIYNKALSADNVATLYAETLATSQTNISFNAPSCVAYYKMSDATDETGSYDGTPSNVNFNVAGKFGNAGEFNGSSSKITTSISVNTANSITYSFWIKPNTENSYITFAAAGTTNTNTLLFQKRGDTNAARLVWFNGSTIPLDLNDTTPMEVGVWTHYAFTLNGSTANLYKNGINTVSNVSYSSAYVFPNFTLGQRPYTPSEFFNGSIDQVRIFNRAITATEVETLYDEVACPCTTNTIDYPTTNVAYYEFDGNADDSTTNGYNGTDTNVTWVQGRFGTAGSFNGSSSKIITSADFDGSTSGGWSISFWFNTTQTTAKALFGSNTIQGGASQGSTVYLGPASGSIADESISFWDFNGSTTSVFYAKGGSTFYQDGDWHHCTIISSSSSKGIWIDGVSQTIYYYISGSVSANAKLTDIIIGDDDTGGGFNFNGKIDQVRIFNTALTSDQVTDLYDEQYCFDNFFNDDSTVATYKLNNTAFDDLGNYNGTASNVTYAAGEFDKAAVFNGSSSYIDTPLNISNIVSNINDKTQDFSFSCWVNISSATNVGEIIYLGNATTYSPSYHGIALTFYNGNLRFEIYDGIASHNIITTISANSWYNIVCVRESSIMKLYVNNSFIGQATQTNNSSISASTVLRLGANINPATYLNGSIDQVRIFDRALDSGEVTQLYNE